jgi:hypothetical protein
MIIPYASNDSAIAPSLDKRHLMAARRYEFAMESAMLPLGYLGSG